MTPTARTLAECRRLGFIAEVVERWVPMRDKSGEPTRAGVRKDLFSFCDVVALDPNSSRVIFIQATTMANATNRKRKMSDEAMFNIWHALNAGVSVQLWCWRKLAKPVNRRWWQVRIETAEREADQMKIYFQETA